MKELILGGARSGKSRYAEQQAQACAQKHQQTLWYIATASIGDEEMAARVKLHQDRRDKKWQLIEEPIHLTDIIRRYKHTDNCLLIDCLTLWLSNILIDEKLKTQWPQIKHEFIDALQRSQASIFMVSNEVGSGIVPMGELSRLFVDESGWLQQELAANCERVTLVTAGLPLMLKDENK